MFVKQEFIHFVRRTIIGTIIDVNDFVVGVVLSSDCIQIFLHNIVFVDVSACTDDANGQLCLWFSNVVDSIEVGVLDLPE